MTTPNKHASIAILMPVFQDQAGAEISLNSVLKALLPGKIHSIVVDDGSVPPLQLDATRFAPIGLILHQLPRNQGIEGALNCGLEIAEKLGVEYIARLDAGDTMQPTRLVDQLQLLREHPQVGIVASDAEFVDAHGRRLFLFRAPASDREIRRRMRLNSCLLHPTVMFRTSVLKALGSGYSTSYPAAEDYEFFLRMLHHTRAMSIQQPLTLKLESPQGISSRKRRRQLLSRLRLQLRYFEPRYVQSYAGLVSTMALFLLPNRWLATLKRFLGEFRY